MKRKNNKYKYVPIRMSIRMFNQIKKDMDNTNSWSVSLWIRKAIKDKLKK